MTTAHATAPRRAAPRSLWKLRLAVFAVPLAILLAVIVWQNVSLHRQIAGLEDQLKPVNAASATLALEKVRYEDIEHLKREYELTVNVIQWANEDRDALPAIHALGPVLSSTPGVSVVSIEPTADRNAVDLDIEITAPTQAAVEKFSHAVEATGSFHCWKPRGYTPGTVSVGCRFAASRESEEQ